METAEHEEEYYLEEVEDEPEPIVEKPKRVSAGKGKPATEYQLANLAKGREALTRRKEERIKKEYDEIAKKQPVKELPPPPTLKRNEPELPKQPKKKTKKKAQRIIIQNDSSNDDSSSSDDEPTIVIRNTRKRNVEKQRPPSPEPEPEYYYEPEPAPFRLRRA
jgi:hypothetical protein